VRFIVPAAVTASLATAACLATSACLATAAVAADQVSLTAPVPEAERRDIVFDLGLGARLGPKFPSAKEYVFSPWPIAELKFLRLPGIGEVVTGRRRAVTIYPAFAFIGERSAADASYLAGTPDVDLAVELGGGIRAQYGIVRGFVEVRQGVTGHSGLVGELGADVVTRPIERLEVSLGPRATLASDDYMDTYFAVGPGAAALPAYDPDAGLVKLGAELDATYVLTERVRVHGYAAYNRFVGDAADSPIVEAGNDDEMRLGIGLTYRFGVDLR